MSVPRLPLPSVNPRPPQLRRHAGGFALLVTLTLLAFVVLLLVGLATYTRIETAISGNTQKQVQARQNALLALDVALGQLQKHAGPDQRVTATAESFGGVTGTRYFTGVWDSTATGPAARTWLVSGNETNPLAITPATTLTTTNAQELVGAKTSTLANDVRAPFVPITTVGVPGQATSATIGRYAWWVGDEGVKAAVGLADRSASVNYPPWTESGATDLRERIRQQISLGAGAADATGTGLFDARAPANATLAGNTVSTPQLAFFNTGTSTTAKVGLTALQQNYHAWSANNFNVLADTGGTGLRRDLSIDPSPLGAEAQGWLGYPSYMESASGDLLRRRYTIRAVSPRVAPVLTAFYLTVGVRKQNASSPYSISLRWGVTLWNPYSSALVPEPLKLEISGLPTALGIFSYDPTTRVENDDITVSLRTLYGQPVTYTLPWTLSSPVLPSERSWLPGRVQNWVNGTGDTGIFNTRAVTAFDDGVPATVPGSSSVNGSSLIGVRVTNPTTLTVRLLRENGEELAVYTSPAFDAVAGTTPATASNRPQQLVFPFRLAESLDTPAAPNVWLTSEGRDPRSSTVPATWLLATPNGTNPSAYSNFSVVAQDRLLDRSPASVTYDEDVPLFELPRAPALSLGFLQHLAVENSRPFAIGNSWGAATSINGIVAGQLFDRFFFSGLTTAVTPTGAGSALTLPNPLLRVNPRAATGATTTASDLRNAVGARSSKFLLQAGAFNVNSASVAAWRAVLRSVRFDSAKPFTYLDANEATGTAEATGETTASITTNDAQFFRFPQSAQETYKATPGLAAGSVTPPSTANTHLFRRGMITLTAAQVNDLATRIVALGKTYASARGPFKTLAEFLGPVPEFLDGAGQPVSLLEKAIADANINVDSAGNPIEFSSQFLTQGDIMTALAPVLFPRSDTFVIRTYGEAVNPNTGVTEGRAWCEATVQRTPEYFDPADDATVTPDALNPTNQTYGRRFKVVSFRWLTRSDI